VQHGTGTAAIVIARRFVKSLFSCKWVGYRVRARVSARVTVRDRDRI